MIIYRDLINSADYVIADGTGVVKAARLLKTPLSERVPGIELMEECLKLAHTNKQRVFLLGLLFRIAHRHKDIIWIKVFYHL